MKSLRTLVVEDEVLITETIKYYLRERGHKVVGSAISYEDAVDIIESTEVDLVLIDIRLYGAKSGIDLAMYIDALPHKIPFVFLTSQYDHRIIQEAFDTKPLGYLTKPIQKETLWTTIELACFKSQQTSEERMISIADGHDQMLVKESDILYVKSEHVYVQVAMIGQRNVVSRMTMREMMDKLDDSKFIWSHRSYIVNMDHIQSWSPNSLHVDDLVIPISRSKKDIVVDRLKAQVS